MPAECDDPTDGAEDEKLHAREGNPRAPRDRGTEGQERREINSVRQGRASVPGDPANFRLHEDSLSGAHENANRLRRPCTGESVHGEETAGAAGRGVVRRPGAKLPR